MALPAWTTAYALFRYADGLSSALIGLAVVFHYGLPLWALALTLAAMNLAGVPAAALWGRVMEQGRGRRRIAVAGFLASAVGMGGLSLLPAFPWFLVAAVLFTVAGVATAPAASILILEGRPRNQWAVATGHMSALMSWTHLAGMATSIVLGLAGRLDYAALFAVAVVACLAAAVGAWAWIAPWRAPLPAPGVVEQQVIRAGQRRLDRMVFRPGRLRVRVDFQAFGHGMRKPFRTWPLGLLLLFAGSLLLFSSYQGVLALHMGLGPGLVLLAQIPSHLATSISYGWAARRGVRLGEGRTAVQGAWWRVGTLSALAVAIIVAAPWSLPLLIVAHAGLGVTFAMVQINSACMMADLHPDGRGAGVGACHAAVGLGVVIGSSLAFVLLSVISFQWVYGLAVLVTLAGALMMRYAWWHTMPEDRDVTTRKAESAA